MIKQAEILEYAELYKLTKNQIDKDWVLSYLLYAIISIPELQERMIFKGGTCLKKCYFPDYRFSEDLDFTLLDNQFVITPRIVNKIIKAASELSFHEDFNRGILVKLKQIVATQSNDVEQGFKVYIHYWGADHRKNDFPSDKQANWHHTIKLDINHTEEIIFPIQEKPILHNLSDWEKFNAAIVRCYSIEEVLSEKLRSLIQRKYTSPRDCYDIWFLKNNCSDLNWQKIKEAFLKKSGAKNIRFRNAEQLLDSRKEKILKQHWDTQLVNQFPSGKLPECNIVMTDLKHFFTDLFKE